LEQLVMNHLWRVGPGDPKTVQEAVGAPRGITLNTVQSTLKRLFEKGLLARDKVSHAHIYRPCVTAREFQRGLLGDLVGSMFEQQGEAVVSAFVDLTERAGPEHLARLEAMVARRRSVLEAERANDASGAASPKTEDAP